MLRGFCVAMVAMLAGSFPAHAGSADLFDELTSDFKYSANNGTNDAEQIINAPFHFRADMLTRPEVYFTLLGAGAALGGAFALDNTIRSHIRGMSNSAATALEDSGTYSLAAGAGLIYVAGLATNDERARHYMLTTGASVAGAELITLIFKYSFGRLRPYQGHGSTAFFDKGQSFVSGETTPVFALATGISAYYDYKWWVTIPTYSAAVAVGLGRMGHDAHWFSDVMGSAIIGIGTTELLLYMHKQYEENPDHYWVFPVSTSRGGGLGVGYDW
jgi:membrane-associated phospholipid phosphatase